MAAVLIGAAFFGVFFSLVQFLRGPWGYSTLAAGVLLTPLTAAPTTVGYLTGRWMEKYGHRVVMVPAAGCMTAGCLWLALMAGPERDLALVWFPAAALIGLGVGTAFPGANSAIAYGLAPSQLGLAAGTVQTLIRIGGAVGVAIGVAMLGDQSSDYDTFYVVMAVMVGLAGVAALGMATHKKEN